MKIDLDAPQIARLLADGYDVSTIADEYDLDKADLVALLNGLSTILSDV